MTFNNSSSTSADLLTPGVFQHPCSSTCKSRTTQRGTLSINMEPSPGCFHIPSSSRSEHRATPGFSQTQTQQGTLSINMEPSPGCFHIPSSERSKNSRRSSTINTQSVPSATIRKYRAIRSLRKTKQHSERKYLPSKLYTSMLHGISELNDSEGNLTEEIIYEATSSPSLSPFLMLDDLSLDNHDSTSSAFVHLSKKLEGPIIFLDQILKDTKQTVPIVENKKQDGCSHGFTKLIHEKSTVDMTTSKMPKSMKQQNKQTSEEYTEAKQSIHTSCFSTTNETLEGKLVDSMKENTKKTSSQTQVYSTKELIKISKLIHDALFKLVHGISIIIESSELEAIFGPGSFSFYLRSYNACMSSLSSRQKTMLDKGYKVRRLADSAALYQQELQELYDSYRQLRKHSKEKKEKKQKKQSSKKMKKEKKEKKVKKEKKTKKAKKAKKEKKENHHPFHLPLVSLDVPLSDNEEEVERPTEPIPADIVLCPHIQAKINANRLLREQVEQSKEFPAVHDMYKSELKKETKHNEHIIKAFNTCKLKDIPEDLKIAYSEYTLLCVFRSTSPLPITNFKSKEEVFQEIVRIQGPPPPPPVMLSSVLSTNEQKQETKEEEVDLNVLYYGPINEEQKEAEIDALVQPRRATTPDSDESSYGRDIEEQEDEKDDEDIDMTESSAFNGSYLQYYEYCLNHTMVPKERSEFTSAVQIDQEFHVIKSREEAKQNIFHSVYRDYYNYGVSNGVVPKVSCEFKTTEDIQQEHTKLKAYIEQKTKVPSIIQAEAEPKEDKKDDPDNSGSVVSSYDFVEFPQFPSHLLHSPAERQRLVTDILIDSWAFRKFPTDVLRYIVVLLIEMEGNNNLISFSHQLIKQVCPKLAVYITVAHHKFIEDTSFEYKWYELIHKVNKLMKARSVWWKKQKESDHANVFKIIHKDWSSLKDIHGYMLQLISAADFQAYIKQFIRQHRSDDFSNLTEQDVHSMFFRLSMVNYPEFLRLVQHVRSIRLPENWVELHADMFPTKNIKVSIQRDPSYETFQNVLISAMGRYCSNYRYYKYTAHGNKALGKGEKDPENKNWKSKFGRLDYRYFRTLNQTLLQYMSILRQLIKLYGQQVSPMKASAEPKEDKKDKEDPDILCTTAGSTYKPQAFMLGYENIKQITPPTPSQYDISLPISQLTIDDVRQDRLNTYYYEERKPRTRRCNYNQKYPKTNQNMLLQQNLEEEKAKPELVHEYIKEPSPPTSMIEDKKEQEKIVVEEEKKEEEEEEFDPFKEEKPTTCNESLHGGMRRNHNPYYREGSVQSTASSAWSPIPWSVSPQPPQVPPNTILQRPQPVIVQRPEVIDIRSPSRSVVDLVSVSPPSIQPKVGRLQRKSRKVRQDPYGPHSNANVHQPLPIAPSRRPIFNLLQSSTFDVTNPSAQIHVPDQPEEVFVPEPVIGPRNLRIRQSHAEPEYAIFDQEGEMKVVERQPRGRPRKPQDQLKYVKQYDHRGRPKKDKAVPRAPMQIVRRPILDLLSEGPIQEYKEEKEEKGPPPGFYDRLQGIEEGKEVHLFDQELEEFKEEVQLQRKRKPGRPSKAELARRAQYGSENFVRAVPNVPRRERMSKAMFSKRQRELQEQLRIRSENARNREEAVIMVNRARNLPYPLAQKVVNVSKHSIPLHKNKWMKYSRILLAYDRTNLNDALNNNRDVFRDQVRDLRPFVEQTVGERIIAWRILLHYDGPNGIHSISTPWNSSYDRAISSIMNMLFSLLTNYDEADIFIHQYEVRARTSSNQLFGGITPKEIQQRLNIIKQSYCIINPRSNTNCLWTSVAVADSYRSKPNIIMNVKVQNKAGYELKKKVGTRNIRGGCDEDVQKCSIYTRKTIEVFDDFIQKVATFQPITPLDPPQTLQLLLQYGHYHAMLPKDDPVVQEYYHEVKEEQSRTSAVIKPLTKEFKERRIVVYDLESWRDPQTVEKELPHGIIRIDKEIHQQAYAVGWCFEIEARNLDELEHARLVGYQIHTCEFLGSLKIFAFKRILGETCLDEALSEWMHDKMFHQAVFYAHNAGKYDARLLLGQSDLMYSSKYELHGDRLIELNGRLINMDVSNKLVEYKVEDEDEDENKEQKQNDKTVRHMISLRDSLPLFGPACSLAKLCKDLDVPHKKLEEKVKVHELMFEDTWRLNWELYDMDKYFLNDCLGLLEVLLSFNQTTLKETGIPITAVNTGASLAKKYYLKHYYRCIIPETDSYDSAQTLYTLTEDVDQFIRHGFGGGRCEAFVSREVQGPLYYYDFTSLYPSVARNLLPTGKPRCVEERHAATFWNDRVVLRRLEQKVAFWKVKVRSPLATLGTPVDPKISKPLFGIKEENMYVFRWFSEWTELVIYEPEILLAIDNNLDYEFQPVSAILFDEHDTLREAMENLFKKKAEAKENKQPALEQTWKIIINSLFGVWGLKVNNRQGLEIATPEKSNWAIDMVTEKLLDIDRVGRYIVTRRLKDLQVKDCNVAVAAAVTSHARMLLYKLFMDIQRKGGEILYCDTDSVITTLCIEEEKELCDKWIGESQGKALGSLKNEITDCIIKYNDKHKDAPLPNVLSFDRAVIVAPKLYYVSAFNHQIIKKANKGYKETDDDIVTYDRMKALIDTTIPKSDRCMVQTTVQWLGNSNDIVRGEIGVRLVERTKYTYQTVNKGILNEDGDVIPFVHPKSKYEL